MKKFLAATVVTAGLVFGATGAAQAAVHINCTGGIPPHIDTDMSGLAAQALNAGYQQTGGHCTISEKCETLSRDGGSAGGTTAEERKLFGDTLLKATCAAPKPAVVKPAVKAK